MAENSQIPNDDDNGTSSSDSPQSAGESNELEGGIADQVGESSTPGPEAAKSKRLPHGPPVFGKWAIWIVLVPFIAYLVGTMASGYLEQLRKMTIEGTLHHHDEGDNRIEIDRSDAHENIPDDAKFLYVLQLNKNSYPYTYVCVIGMTTALVVMFGWGYFKAPFSVSYLSVLVGLVGIVAWIGITELDRMTLDLGGFSERPSFNPFDELKDSGWMWQFIGIRFFGLVIIVPLVEEFFIRGFLMRYVDDPDWDLIPLGIGNTAGWLSPTIYGVVAHLTEPVAALVWFSMVTLLYKKTGSIWDCVVAHAVTNLCLGIYVVYFGAWYMW